MLSGDFRANVRELWLNYCQANLVAINGIIESGWRKTAADGNYRPSAMLILGVLCGLSSEFANLIPVLLTMTNDTDQVIKALGLDFGPEEELEKRAEELSKIQDVEAVPLLTESTLDPDTEYLNQFRNSGV